MAVNDLVMSRPGQVNKTGAVDAMFLKLFLGEVLTACDEKNIMKDLHMIRTIDHGKSASFPILGKATARYHVPGTPILGFNQIAANERVINIDDLLIADVAIYDLEDAKNHYDVRGEYSKQIGAALAREFDKKNHLGHNDYSGITVTLIYEAVLNDLAADRTGRPGFENNVRLEFSNDADVQGKGETGYTPWDTVVCFTFQLCGSKINEAGLPLEGAGFRLYSDEECRNEVFVKAKPNESGSYIVINRDSLGGEDHTGGSVPEEAAEMCSSEDGNFTIYGLDQGIYYLKETKAPDGYRLPTDENGEPIVWEICAESDVAENAFVFWVNDKAYTGKEGQYRVTGTRAERTVEMTIYNFNGSELPETGSFGMILQIAAGSLLILVPYMSGLSKSKKEDIYE